MTASRAQRRQFEFTEDEVKRRRPGMWATLVAFLRADFIEEISYPASFAFSILRSIMPLLLSFFIGQLIADERVGNDYLTFVSIGLGTTAMLAGALAGFGGVMSRAFQRGTLETYLVEPVPWTVMPLAMNTWPLFIAIFNGGVLMVVGSWLGANYDLSQLPMFLLLVFLGMVATTAIGIMSASILMLTLKSQPILSVYSMLGGLLAGSVFSVSQLPVWLRPLSWLIPHTYVINGSRSLLMTDPGSFEMPVSTALLVLTGFSIVAFPLGMLAFRKSLETSRRMGMLSGY